MNYDLSDLGFRGRGFQIGWGTFLLSLLSLMVLVVNSGADSLHNNTPLLGGRATGMGGAYRAVSDDPSGCYYNPAGIALSFERSLSGSTNVFSVTDLVFKHLFGGQVDWKRTSQTYNGNFVGYVNPLGGGKLGFSIVIPESELEKQDVEITSLSVNAGEVERYKLDRSVSDTSYLLGPSYGYRVHPKISVGATLYLYYRSLEESQNELIFFDDKKYESNNIQNSRNEWGIRPLLGIILSPLDKLSVGLTFSKTKIVRSNEQEQVFQRRFGASSVLWTDDCSGGSDDQCFIRSPESKERRKTPEEFAMGLAFFPSQALLLSADLIYHTGVTDNEFGNKSSTTDIALGVEYYYSNSFVLRGGFYSNQANTKNLEVGKTDQLPHVDLLGGTFSLSHMGRTRSLSFGVNYSTGSGSGQAIGGTPQVQDVEMNSYALFMSGEFHL